MNFNFTAFPVLGSEKLSLREITQEDVQVIFDLRSSEEINKFVGTKRIKDIGEAKDFILKCKDSYEAKNLILWGIEYKKEIIGTIVLHQINIENSFSEIGYKLKPEFQKRGLMSEALKTVINFGFQENSLKTIEAYTHKNNIASIALLEKHKFVYQPKRRCQTYDFNRIYKLEKN